MMVKCPTCKKLHEYDMNSPWASGSYVIHGQPGSADPDLIVEQLERMQREKEEEEREGKCK